MSEPKILRRCVIKEELVELTGDPLEAVVLSQLLYWTPRVRDYQQMLAEEKALLARGEQVCQQPKHGWIYKKADELCTEIMIAKAATTVRRAIMRLVAKKFLQELGNPRFAWDKTRQYRVNLVLLQQALAEIGYPLEGFDLTTESDLVAIDDNSEATDCYLPKAVTKLQSAASSELPAGSNLPSAVAITKNTSQKTIEKKDRHSTFARSRQGARTAEPATTASTDSETVYPLQFEEFWEVYPKKRRKTDAYRLWQDITSRSAPSATPDELVTAALNYAVEVADRELRYVMNPTTFLGEDGDYLEYVWPDCR